MMKWYSKTEYVDVETGELLTKSQYERRNLRVIKKVKSYEFKNEGSRNAYGIITWMWECRPHEQLRINI